MKYLMAFLFIITSIPAFSQIESTPVEFVHVYAISGLNLRAEPHEHAKVLDVVEFGDQVRVVTKTKSFPDRVGWVSGHWIKVSFEGIEGYLFDGYLSNLAFPIFEFELCNQHSQLIYALDSYMDYHFFPALEADTSFVEPDQLNVSVLHHEGYKMKREVGQGLFKLTVDIPDVRVMDAYHLLRSMLTNNSSLIEFSDQSVFIEDPMGEIVQIKVKLEEPIQIKKMKNGKVRISLFDHDDGCSL